MLTPARVAILAAIACTMWFNGCYAWSKGGSNIHQASMVALALTIDLCKATFLSAASKLWAARWRLAPAVLVLLWPFALAYSTFAGYAYLVTQRTQTAQSASGIEDRHTRAQAEYDRAKSTLDTAQTSPLWQSTAACTSARTEKQKNFCLAHADAERKLQAADAAVSNTPDATADAELTVLAETTGWSIANLTLVVALAPALLLELVASIGLYAVSGRIPQNAPQRRQNAFSPSTAPGSSTNAETKPKAAPDRSSEVDPPQTDPARPTKSAWTIPQRT